MCRQTRYRRSCGCTTNSKTSAHTLFCPFLRVGNIQAWKRRTTIQVINPPAEQADWLCRGCGSVVDDVRFDCEGGRSNAVMQGLKDHARLAEDREEYEGQQAERRERWKREKEVEMVSELETGLEDEENADPQIRGLRTSPLQAVETRGFGFAWKAGKNLFRRL